MIKSILVEFKEGGMYLVERESKDEPQISHHFNRREEVLEITRTDTEITTREFFPIEMVASVRVESTH